MNYDSDGLRAMGHGDKNTNGRTDGQTDGQSSTCRTSGYDDVVLPLVADGDCDGNADVDDDDDDGLVGRRMVELR